MAVDTDERLARSPRHVTVCGNPAARSAHYARSGFPCTLNAPQRAAFSRSICLWSRLSGFESLTPSQYPNYLVLHYFGRSWPSETGGGTLSHSCLCGNPSAVPRGHWIVALAFFLPLNRQPEHPRRGVQIRACLTDIRVAQQIARFDQ